MSRINDRKHEGSDHSLLVKKQVLAAQAPNKDVNEKMNIFLKFGCKKFLTACQFTFSSNIIEKSNYIVNTLFYA